MKRTNRLTEGNILHTLIRFAVPVFFTLFLQALYGGVDLLVVGQFAATADVSGVATGSMLMSTVTMVITGLSMGQIAWALHLHRSTVYRLHDRAVRSIQ